jgi:hypothetical protein
MVKRAALAASWCVLGLDESLDLSRGRHTPNDP